MTRRPLDRMTDTELAELREKLAQEDRVRSSERASAAAVHWMKTFLSDSSKRPHRNPCECSAPSVDMRCITDLIRAAGFAPVDRF